MLVLAMLAVVLIVRLIQTVPELRTTATGSSQRMWLGLLCALPSVTGVVTGAVMPAPSHDLTAKLVITGILVVCFALILTGAGLSRSSARGTKRMGAFLMLGVGSFVAGFELGRYVGS